MKVYKYDEATGGIVAHDSGSQMDVTVSESPVTVNIPMHGSYSYQHGKTGFTKIPAKGQTPTWNFNNPLKNWKFPILNKLKDLFFKDGADSSIPVAPSASSSQFPQGTTDVNGDGVINVLDILAAQQIQGSQPSQQIKGPSLPLVPGQVAPPLSQGTVPPELSSTQDVNNDGIVNVLDILAGMQTPSSATEQLDTDLDLPPIDETLPKRKEELPASVPESIDSTDYGLFQINDYWHNEETQDNIWNQYIHPKDMSSIEQISYAKSLYDREGWDVWEVYNNGSYSDFLD